MITLLIQRWKVSIQQHHIEPSLLLLKIDVTVGEKKLLTLKNGQQWIRVKLLACLKLR